MKTWIRTDAKKMTDYKTDQVKSVVKKWTRGGAYVSVPSLWAGKEVIVTLAETEKSARPPRQAADGL